ncbi:MAG: AarF/ABC1/UbiB kinase family protein [Hyphomicrobiaceae bacterium]|nr:AarF/ABC1/UbiB kinase family protein [Hyphomicrobiaceae bacterium]
MSAGDDEDTEANRLTARLSRYARVGVNVGGVAMGALGRRMLREDGATGRDAEALAAALGGLKGPLMKVAQILSTIPDAVPKEYAAELSRLQSEAPPMGPAFVKRRMRSELGPNWQERFARFDIAPAAAASLGQVHRAVHHDGTPLAVKLQYPDMASAVEADLKQLDVIFAVQRRMDKAIDTSEIRHEIADRLREELDYRLEARHAALYRGFFGEEDTLVTVPRVHADLSTGRLLTLDWVEGTRLLSHKGDRVETRRLLTRALFHAWWRPFVHLGVIHGDPHLGNYTVRSADGAPDGINLLDYGCIRKFPPRFIRGVIGLYHGLLHDDRARIEEAYTLWGFKDLKRETIDTLNVWARFIYGPLLDDRVRKVAEGVNPAEYGREQVIAVRRALKEQGRVLIPREFVFMDRAAIGLGGVFIHLDADLNFYRIFNEEIEGFSASALEERQSAALAAAGLEPVQDEKHRTEA